MQAPRRIRSATRGSYWHSCAVISLRCQAKLSAADRPPVALIAVSSLISSSGISSIYAPACRSTCRLCENALATVLLRPSCICVRATASRQEDRGLPASCTARADRISWTVTASRTERVTAQTVSRLVERGTAPVAGTSRAVLLKPTMPQSAAGIRIEPPVSEPSPTKAAPVATDTAAPDEEPPGMRSVS